MQFWCSLEPYIERGESAVVTLVARSTRHSPGTVGARMFVTSGGVQHGTIGGGAMEAEVKRRSSRMLLGAEEPSVRAETLVHRATGKGTRSGLICAGEQTNVTWLVTPEVVGDVSTLADFEREGRPALFELGPSGHQVGDGRVDVRTGPVVFEQSGEDWFFRETVFPWRRATIMGGGHCGLALSRTLNQLGYHVTLFDVREDCPTVEENLWAHEIRIVGDYADAAVQLSYRALQHVVVMTADFPSDTRALLGLSRVAGVPFVGLMGSPAKLHKIRATLREEGVSEEFLDSLRAPVGLRIKSNTPEEIAISVAAEILSVRDALFPYSKWPEVEDA